MRAIQAYVDECLAQRDAKIEALDQDLDTVEHPL